MARREVDDEKRSYSGVFLFAVGLLLIGSVWSVWDDAVSRRPWKKYQAEFSMIAYNQTLAEIQAEEERLAAEPAYQEALTTVESAQADIMGGEGGQRLAALQTELAAAEIRTGDAENALRIVRSEIEAAWYEYDHAIQLEHATKDEKDHLDALQAEAVERERVFLAEQSERDRIENEINEINARIIQAQETLRTMQQQKDFLEQRIGNYVLRPLPGLVLPAIPAITQVVVPEFDRSNFDTSLARVDRCQSCHVGIDKRGFEDQPNPHKTHPQYDVLMANHPPESFGCTSCHNGQGVATSSVDIAHGYVQFWEHPLLLGPKMEANCLSCHADMQTVATRNATVGQHIARGERLFMQLGCTGCHVVEGYGEVKKIGPYLRRVAAKSDPAWMVEWVTNPHEFRPHTRMPHFFLTEDQGRAATAYLLRASREEGQAWLDAHAEPEGIDPNNAELVQTGERLVNSLGCRACHGFNAEQTATLVGQSKNHAPNLARVAEKTNARWLYHWIKNPRAYAPNTAMPDLRLSDTEAQAIVSYLLTLKTEIERPDIRAELEDPDLILEGEGLVRQYGCHGCHDIPGMEREARIGVELTSFGEKSLEELFFGNRTDVPHTWEDWTYEKVNAPRGYATERIEQLMPSFNLSNEDILAVRVFLKSQTGHHVPERFTAHGDWTDTIVKGQRLVQYYNCTGCHVIEGSGGDIRSLYLDNPALAPPILTGQGKKVQPEWFYGFLKRPIPIRPWLALRMPTFHFANDEASGLVDYFNALSKLEIPYNYFDHSRTSPDMLHAGAALMSEDYFACFSCHQQGDQKPEGPPDGWAPDLGLAKERLNPEWIVEWIRDPQALMPGTKMPTFYPGGPDDIFAGDEDKQMVAMRDYIMLLGIDAPFASMNGNGASGAAAATVQEAADETATLVEEPAQSADEARQADSTEATETPM